MEFQFYAQKFITFNGKEFDVVLRDETSDFNTIQASLVEDEYGLKDFKFKDDDLIIDIGSATGGEALLLSAINPNIKILCFEPLPENAELLTENLSHNKVKNYAIYQTAVCGKPGWTLIYYGALDSESGRHHHFIGNSLNVPQGKKIYVPALTLEEIFRDLKIKSCKMLRMDPEGAEYEILKKTPIEILKKIDWIVGEHHLVPRAKMLAATRGLFRDVPCAWQSEGNLGHFRFERIKNE